MPQHESSPTRSRSRSSNRSWLGRKLHRLRNSSQAQKELRHLVIIIAAVLVAFVLGYYFLGPGFSASE
ncbi:MAG: hypothetical protein WCK54_06585 [Desulfuromonadales bacterium]